MSGVDEFIVNWIDLIWIPVSLLVVIPRHRKIALAFMILCAITMRLQIDLIHSTGFNTGFTKIFTSDVKLRATIIYGVFCALFLLLLHFSPRSYWSTLLSASIGVYIMAFTVSMIFMAL
jgi:hypothetical protein